MDRAPTTATPELPPAGLHLGTVVVGVDGSGAATTTFTGRLGRLHLRGALTIAQWTAPDVTIHTVLTRRDPLAAVVDLRADAAMSPGR